MIPTVITHLERFTIEFGYAGGAALPRRSQTPEATPQIDRLERGTRAQRA